MNVPATGGKHQRSYIPAAGFHWLLPLFDFVTRLTGADAARSALLQQAELRPGQQILDIGCGTGTLAILLKQLHPQTEVVALDPDPKALALARRKAQRAAVSPRFDQGFSDALEYPTDSFDHVFSSFMFHHLRSYQKEETVREIRRVLKPGGYLHLLDFRGPNTGDTRAVTRWFHSRNILRDNAETRMLELITRAELAEAHVVRRQTVVFGFAHIAYYQACALKSPFSKEPRNLVRFPEGSARR
ncbi:MAG TPA: class I SAM-dependent methyltransferase [Candidatus Acidoferrales bacterium]